MKKEWLLLGICFVAVAGYAAPATGTSTLKKPSSSVGVFHPQTSTPVIKPTTVTPVVKPVTNVVVEHPVTNTPVWRPTTPVAEFQSSYSATNTSAKDAPTTMGGNVLSAPKDFKKESTEKKEEKKGFALQHNVGGMSQASMAEIETSDKHIDSMKAMANKFSPTASTSELKSQADEFLNASGVAGIKDRVKEKAGLK